jgi:hypothetical protein
MNSRRTVQKEIGQACRLRHWLVEERLNGGEKCQKNGAEKDRTEEKERKLKRENEKRRKREGNE